MRKLTELESETEAGKLAHWMTKLGISSTQIENQVWVMEDDHMRRAKSLLKQNIETAPWKSLPAVIPAKSQEISIKTKNRTINLTTQPNLTISLIFISTIVFLALENNVAVPLIKQYLMLYLPNAFAGEIWRFITPIFMHFGWLHIIFNMIWTYQLGTQIELLQSRKSLLILVLTIGVISNFAQAFLSGPNFGGMSGVIYGLLGYIWAMNKWHPNTKLFVDNGTMGFMMVWLVLCITGVFGNVANTAHIAGLIAGVGLAKVTALRA